MRLIVHCNIQGCMVTLFTLHHSHTYLHVGGCCDTVGGCSTDAIPPETHHFYTKLTTDILVKRVAFHLSVPQARAQAEGGEGANTVVADGLAAEAAVAVSHRFVAREVKFKTQQNERYSNGSTDPDFFNDERRCIASSRVREHCLAY